MKVAFDGTVLHGRNSGVGYYCEELLKAILAANHDDEFFVLDLGFLDDQTMKFTPISREESHQRISPPSREK